MTTDQHSTGDEASSETFELLLRRDGWALLITAAATIAIELGVYVAALGQGVGDLNATLATLAATTLWVTLAAPIFSAGASNAWAAFLRSATICDASAVALIVLWITARDEETAQAYVPLMSALEIYCTLACMAIASTAIVRCGRSSAGRHVLGVATACAFTVMLASPFWVGGLLNTGGQTFTRAVVNVAVYANGFYSISSIVGSQSGFVWHRASVMYGITRIGDFCAAPAIPWYAAAAVYSCLAGIAGGVNLIRRKETLPRR